MFTFSLSSSGKGLNFITAIPLHPACLSKFPLVAINIYFTNLSSIGGNFGWNKVTEVSGAKINGFRVEQTIKIYETVKQTNPW